MWEHTFLRHKKGDIALQYVILFSALSLGTLALGMLFQNLFTTQTCVIKEKLASLTVSSSLNSWRTLTTLQRRQLIWKQKIHPFLKEASAYGEQNQHMLLRDYLPIYLRQNESNKICPFESQNPTAKAFYRKYLAFSKFFYTQDVGSPSLQNDKIAVQKLQNYINKNANDKSLQRFFSP